MFKSGTNPLYKHTCKHPLSEKGILSEGNLKDDKTPNWCPLSSRLISSRSSGKTFDMINNIVVALRQSQIVFLAQNIENKERLDIILVELKKRGLQNIEVERKTRKEPLSNVEIIFDEWQEPVGIKNVPQIDVFIGYLLKI